MRRRSLTRQVGAGLAVAVFAGCAREEMPPGHGPDFEPPAVVEMFPAHGAVVPDLDDDAFIQFDEPLGDPRSMERSFVTSPAWPYIVKVGRRNARIRPRDGWRRGVVYQFTLPPGVRDLIRNQTREPIEFLFSTADTITATTTQGRVLDRVTVRTVRDARVLVIGPDSVPYSAVTDTGGKFSVISLPLGDYWAFAFRDQDRNLVLDRTFEAHDSGRVELPDFRSEVTLELWLVPPDSTPPVLVSAQSLDSVRVELSFDELLEPDWLLDSASVEVRRQDTGEVWPTESFLVGPLDVVEDLTPEGEAEDAETLTPEAEDVEGVVDPVAQALVDEESGMVADTSSAVGPVPEERSRPYGTVTVLLGRPLETATYEVSARGFANLRHFVGGGDTTFVYEPQPDPQVPAPVEDDSISGVLDVPEPDEGEP